MVLQPTRLTAEREADQLADGPSSRSALTPTEMRGSDQRDYQDDAGRIFGYFTTRYSSRSAPMAMRYHPNCAIVRVLTKWTNQRTANRAAMNETPSSVSRIGRFPGVITLRFDQISTAEAGNSTGTAAKNEISAAAFRLSPRNRPPTMVDAERENPGHRAKH